MFRDEYHELSVWTLREMIERFGNCFHIAQVPVYKTNKRVFAAVLARAQWPGSKMRVGGDYPNTGAFRKGSKVTINSEPVCAVDRMNNRECFLFSLWSRYFTGSHKERPCSKAQVRVLQRHWTFRKVLQLEVPQKEGTKETKNADEKGQER